MVRSRMVSMQGLRRFHARLAGRAALRLWPMLTANSVAPNGRLVGMTDGMGDRVCARCAGRGDSSCGVHGELRGCLVRRRRVRLPGGVLVGNANERGVWVCVWLRAKARWVRRCSTEVAPLPRAGEGLG
ncbi:hypothetical protein [Lysobacter gummosus]|uniref:hypothetical protein n=1 Tax=Lysobacter gummosus TaxID=262324 RepID=UPI0036268FB4